MNMRVITNAFFDKHFGIGVTLVYRFVKGNVEIFHDRKWGSICDDEWDNNEGIVACKQLGFKGLVKVTHNSYFGTSTSK